MADDGCISFVVVVNGADMLYMGNASSAGPRYTRDSIRGLLQILGCKPRHAFKIMKLFFLQLHQRIQTSKTREDRFAIQVHDQHNGCLYVCISRPDFMELVTSCAAKYEYKLSPNSEDLKVSCRCDIKRRSTGMGKALSLF